MPPKNITSPVTVNDAGARFGPATSRRLFFLEQEANPVVRLDRKGKALPRVRLDLPDNGSRRDGPGRFESRGVTMIIHASGCAFTVIPCGGDCVAPKAATP
jgi:hypothetical protein